MSKTEEFINYFIFGGEMPKFERFVCEYGGILNG